MSNYEPREQRQAERDGNTSPLNAIKLLKGDWIFVFVVVIVLVFKESPVLGEKASKSVPHVGKIQPLANVT